MLSTYFTNDLNVNLMQIQIYCFKADKQHVSDILLLHTNCIPVLWTFGLQNIALMEIIKYDHTLYHTEHKFAII
jgi:hypothetical protein